MRVIYIAGKYRAPDEWGVTLNICEAEKAAIFVWQHGGAALCPHKNTAYFGGVPGCHDEVWLAGDIEMLKRCDAIFAIDGWRNSNGAIMEVEIARENGLTCLFCYQEVIDYLLKAVA